MAKTSSHKPEAQAPSLGTQVMWVSLAAVAVVLLLSFTNQLTQDVASIPFLWVLPLSIYLLTFIIAFDADRWYVRRVFIGLLVPTLAVIIIILILSPGVSLILQLVAYNAGLFVCCMFCHGELARLRPHPERLTGYYLMISLGGALGGLFVAIIAPAIFTDYYELHAGLLAITVLSGIVMLNKRWTLLKQVEIDAWAAVVGIILIVGVALGREIWLKGATIVDKTRNFYGTLTVTEDNIGEIDERRWFLSGAIFHGVQYTDPERAEWATAYFDTYSGVGRALEYYAGEPRRIGILGLGIGTLTTYGEPGDYIRIYEINPEVEDYAREYFTYLDNSDAEIEVVLGDGRLELESEEPQAFDLLVLDAFSGDSVPVHLLTEEAFAEYLRHLTPDGTLAVNITNIHLNLQPVIRAAADAHDLQAVRIYTGSNEFFTILTSDWMLLTRNEEMLESIPLQVAVMSTPQNEGRVRLWTDDYTSLFPILRWR